MSSTFIVKPLQIIKTARFLNQTVAVEGYISLIEYNGDEVLINIRDQTDDLNIIFSKEQIKIFGSKLRKIKNSSKKIKIIGTGILKLCNVKSHHTNDFELLIENFSLENKAGLFTDVLNTSSSRNLERYKYIFTKR